MEGGRFFYVSFFFTGGECSPTEGHKDLCQSPCCSIYLQTIWKRWNSEVTRFADNTSDSEEVLWEKARWFQENKWLSIITKKVGELWSS